MSDDIRKEIEQSLPKIELKSKNLLSNLLVDISKFEAYDLLSRFMSALIINSIFNSDDIKSDVEVKFALETVQMLLTCIEEKDFKKNELQDNDFFKIEKEIEELFNLENQYAIAKDFELGKENEGDSEYIFENIIDINITGKRYQLFENKHHKEILKPVENELKDIYGITIDEIINGIANIRDKYIYGFMETMDSFENLINEVGESKELIEEQQKKGNEFIENAFFLGNHNIKNKTKWPTKFIEIFSFGLGDNKDFLKDINMENFIELHNKIKSKPIIKIGADFYNISISRLLDDFDKNILKDVYKKNEYKKETIKSKVSKNCENYTAKLFGKILPNSNIFCNNYYKEGKNFIENDILIENENILLIVEVKAGNFTNEIAIKDIESHKKSLYELVERADLQSERFFKTLSKKKSVEIYDDNKKRTKIKKVININDYSKVYKIIITLEGFNEIAARAEKVNILKMNKNTIVCSIDDLEVYADFFNSNPIEFMHYLNYRFKATESELINLNDELDHLGLYLEYNDYSLKAKEICLKYKDVNSVIWEEPRKEIDDYYRAKSFKLEVDKPGQKMPKNLKKILDYLNLHSIKYSIEFFSNILNGNENARNIIENYILMMIDFYKINKRPKYCGIKIKDNLFITCIVEDNNKNINNLLIEFYANMKIKNIDYAYVMIITYDKNENILCIYIDKLTSQDEKYNSKEVNVVFDEIKNRRERKISKKVGRNERCPCGSGLKYKKCCGKNI